MPSHSKGVYNDALLEIADSVSNDFDFINYSTLIKRTADKTKSTEGGVRTVAAHLSTMGLAHSINKNNIDNYIILDDITTTGSSLEAAKSLLVSNGISSSRIIKIAIAKTSYNYSL